jgi:hypothetical protein
VNTLRPEEHERHLQTLYRSYRPAGARAMCGTTSQPQRPTTNRSTHRASPDNRPRTADPLTCSLTGPPQPSGQQVTRGRLAHLQPRRTSAQQPAAQDTLTRLELDRTTAQLR